MIYRMMIEAWHFVGSKLRDGSPIPADGVTLRHEGELVMCRAGFHASERIIDALSYAPGNTICRVRCGGEIIRDSDTLVCSERTILWRVDGEALLRDFARQCALDVIHLWDAPEVVRKYLETGDESLREDAWDAAWADARAAAWDAAWAAAGASTWAGARVAAGAAAWASAEAARDAAGAAAREAARAAQNERLERMVMEAKRRG